MTSLAEGLEDSGRHCFKVLSVAGFFDLRCLFPLGRWVYSEVGKAPFLRGDPLLVDVVARSAHPPAPSTSNSLFTRGGGAGLGGTYPTYTGRWEGC